MELRKILMAVVGGALVLGGGLAAQAGKSQLDQVTVITSPVEAFGSLKGARNSGDSVQWIGSQLNQGPTASCYATDKGNHSVSCVTADADMIRMVTAVGSSSWIWFKADRNAQCSLLVVNNLSTRL